MRFVLNESLKRKMQKWQKAASQYPRDIEFLKKRMGNAGVVNLWREITKRGLIDTGEMRAKISYKVVPDGIIFTSGAEYSSYLEKGIRKHVMTYLQKANGPIPIKVRKFSPRTKSSGQMMNGVIFRTPTAKSFRRKNAWIHPGFDRGKGFFRSAMKKTLKETTRELKALNKKYYR